MFSYKNAAASKKILKEAGLFSDKTKTKPAKRNPKALINFIPENVSITADKQESELNNVEVPDPLSLDFIDTCKVESEQLSFKSKPSKNGPKLTGIALQSQALRAKKIEMLTSINKSNECSLSISDKCYNSRTPSSVTTNSNRIESFSTDIQTQTISSINKNPTNSCQLNQFNDDDDDKDFIISLPMKTAKSAKCSATARKECLQTSATARKNCLQTSAKLLGNDCVANTSNRQQNGESCSVFITGNSSKSQTIRNNSMNHSKEFDKLANNIKRKKEPFPKNELIKRRRLDDKFLDSDHCGYNYDQSHLNNNTFSAFTTKEAIKNIFIDDKIDKKDLIKNTNRSMTYDVNTCGTSANKPFSNHSSPMVDDTSYNKSYKQCDISVCQKKNNNQSSSNIIKNDINNDNDWGYSFTIPSKKGYRCAPLSPLSDYASPITTVDFNECSDDEDFIIRLPTMSKTSSNGLQKQSQHSDQTDNGEDEYIITLPDRKPSLDSLNKCFSTPNSVLLVNSNNYASIDYDKNLLINYKRNKVEGAEYVMPKSLTPMEYDDDSLSQHHRGTGIKYTSNSDSGYSTYSSASGCMSTPDGPQQMFHGGCNMSDEDDDDEFIICLDPKNRNNQSSIKSNQSKTKNHFKLNGYYSDDEGDDELQISFQSRKVRS